MSRRQRRWARVFAYVAFAAAGAAEVVWPAPSVKAATAPTAGIVIYVWAAFLLLGGIMSAAGAVLDLWIGEYCGLPLLASVFAVYGLAIAATGKPTSYALALAFIAVAAFQVGRWRDVAAIRRESARYLQDQR